MEPQLAHLIRVGALRVDTAARRMSRRDLDTFFLGTGCLAILDSLPLDQTGKPASGKPLTSLSAEGGKVNLPGQAPEGIKPWKQGEVLPRPFPPQRATA